MAVIFDPTKDRVNIEKHGISLTRAEDLESAVAIEDNRKTYGEVRIRAFGYIDGKPHCLVFTRRGNDIRAISSGAPMQGRSNAMPGKRKQPFIDDENPEWSKEDFARAKPLQEVLPPGVLKNFKRHRGQQKDPTKVPVSIRLSRDVVEHFKASGPGWQGRIDEALMRIAKRRTNKRKGKAA